MKQLLLFKANRLISAIKTMPLFVLIIFGLIVTFVFYTLLIQFTQTPNTYYIWGGFTMLLYSLHINRKDVNFCYLILSRPRMLFVLEYLLMFSPLIILSITTQTYLNLVLYGLSPILIGLAPHKRTRCYLKPIPSILRVESLELISFLRKYYILILITIFTSLALSYVPYLSLIVLLVFVLIMDNAYIENEPLNMLFLEELSANKYMWKKIISGYTLYVKLTIPTLILYSVLNIKIAFWGVLPLLVGFVGIMLFVVIKYSLYEANNSKITTPLIASIGMIGIIIPFFLPITMLLICVYYSTAQENLNKYLYVYNK